MMIHQIYPNPPTPADARGSAPGKKTFDPYYQSRSSSSNRSTSSIVHQACGHWVAYASFELSPFSMGFRSYVREFWGAILMLLRPSLPLCFPIRQLSFEQKEQQQQQKGEKSS